MQTFTSTDLNRTSGAILQAAEEQGAVEIRKGSKVFILKYVSPDEDADTYVNEEPVRKPRAGRNDDLLASLLASSNQQSALLQELVDLAKRDIGTQPLQVAEPGMVTARIDEEPVAPERPKVVIPERLPQPKPEKPGEPSQDELRAAHEYYGLQETVDGLEITERGIQRALGTVAKIARQDPESTEAQILKMDAASEDRIECLRLVQIDKLSNALAKRAAGDPRWLGAATPPRF
ncbi:hypothetical protein ABZS71_06710 [Streptomyces sp. NPDC005393]|uniref:hypothetical protein n=1 Tax=Streptomyces sp. NPDC005393 TaxID=3157041 RepID=UPI0033AA14A1